MDGLGPTDKYLHTLTHTHTHKHTHTHTHRTHTRFCLFTSCGRYLILFRSVLNGGMVSYKAHSLLPCVSEGMGGEG